MNTLEITIKKFEELSLEELYEISVLRQEVFVVEQNAAYQDSDGLDYEATHFFVFSENKILAYCRLIPVGLKYKEMSLGRVVVSPSRRGLGLGHLLVKTALEYQFNTFGTKENRISAQTYLLDFYGQYGYKVVGVEYLEDGLPHFEMVR